MRLSFEVKHLGTLIKTSLSRFKLKHLPAQTQNTTLLRSQAIPTDQDINMTQTSNFALSSFYFPDSHPASPPIGEPVARWDLDQYFNPCLYFHTHLLWPHTPPWLCPSSVCINGRAHQNPVAAVNAMFDHTGPLVKGPRCNVTGWDTSNCKNGSEK